MTPYLVVILILLGTVLASMVVVVYRNGVQRGEVSLLRGRVRAMANEIGNLNDAVSVLASKIDAATARVAVLEARPTDGIPAADVALATDNVTALGLRVDALAPSIAPSS